MRRSVVGAPGLLRILQSTPEDRAALSEPVGDGDSDERETALGLAVARWVTDLHGGAIEVVDRPRGCLIRASIPLADPPAD